MHTHTVSRGETPADICDLYDVDGLDLVLANPEIPWMQLEDGSMTFAELYAGQEIRLPLSTGSSSSALDKMLSTCPLPDRGCPDPERLARAVAHSCVAARTTMGAPLFLEGGDAFVHSAAIERLFVESMGAGALVDVDAATRVPGADVGAGDDVVWQWKELPPDSEGDFQIKHGERYAGLVSVSSNYTLVQITQKLASKGVHVTYAWEWGQPNRGKYVIDDWIAKLPKDTTSNHRWVYLEGNADGPDTSAGQTSPWPFTIYRVAHVFQSVPVKKGQTPQPLPPPDSPGCPVIPSRVPVLLGGVAAGAAIGVLGAVAFGAMRARSHAMHEPMSTGAKAAIGAGVGLGIGGLVAAVILAPSSAKADEKKGDDKKKTEPPPLPPKPNKKPDPKPAGVTWKRVLIVEPGDRVRMAISAKTFAQLAAGLGVSRELDGFLDVFRTPPILAAFGASDFTVWPPAANTLPADWPKDDPAPADEYHVEYTVTGRDVVDVRALPIPVAAAWIKVDGAEVGGAADPWIFWMYWRWSPTFGDWSASGETGWIRRSRALLLTNRADVAQWRAVDWFDEGANTWRESGPLAPGVAWRQ